MNYRTEYRADWTHQIQIKSFGSDKQRAQNYARRYSDGKCASVYVVASDDTGDLGHRSYFNGYHEADDGAYA